MQNRVVERMQDCRECLLTTKIKSYRIILIGRNIKGGDFCKCEEEIPSRTFLVSQGEDLKELMVKIQSHGSPNRK